MGSKLKTEQCGADEVIPELQSNNNQSVAWAPLQSQCCINSLGTCASLLISCTFLLDASHSTQSSSRGSFTVNRETDFETGLGKKVQFTFTKTYSGSNNLISTYILIYLKLKFPAVISETTALWECKRQTVKLIWVFPSCFLRFGWHPILPSPCCLLSHFSPSNCSFYFYLSNNSLMCFFWFFECASFDFLALNQILGPIFAFWPGKLVLFPLKWTKKRNKNKWYKLIVLAPQWNHKL